MRSTAAYNGVGTVPWYTLSRNSVFAARWRLLWATKAAIAATAATAATPTKIPVDPELESSAPGSSSLLVTAYEASVEFEVAVELEIVVEFDDVVEFEVVVDLLTVVVEFDAVQLVAG